MERLFKKLNYKGQKRIALLNAGDEFGSDFLVHFQDVVADREIDPRYPYEFILIFVRNMPEIRILAPRALHNLVMDGTLWFAFPRSGSKRNSSDLDRDHGWEALTERGFEKVRQVIINDDWSALRFRNIRFIRSLNGSGRK